MMLETRLAWRRLRSSPVFSIFAIVSIAVGVGVPAVIYAAIAAMLWPPIGVTSPDSLFLITGSHSASVRRAFGVVPAVDLEPLAELKSAAIAGSAEFFELLQTGSVAEPIRGEAISEAYFPLLGVVPVLGTIPTDVSHANSASAVISHDLWRTRFGGNHLVLGTPLKLGRGTFQVVAVAPREFTGIHPPGAPSTSIWISLRDYQDGLRSSSRSWMNVPITVAARLRPDASPASLNAELTALGTALDRADQPRSEGASSLPVSRSWASARLRTVIAEAVGSATRLSYLGFGLLAALFIVACTNLANLTWARATQRHEELALRQALGASRLQITLSTLSESTILTACGALCAYAVFRVLAIVLTLDVPLSATTILRAEPELTRGVLGLSIIGLIVALGIFGVEPAVHALRAGDPNLAAIGTGATRRSKTQTAFVRWQVAICTTFVFVAAVSGRAAFVASQRDSGLPLDTLLVSHLDFTGYGNTEESAAAARDAVVSGLEQRFGEGKVALTNGMPFGVPGTPLAALASPDQPFRRNVEYFQALVIGATPSIVETLSFTLVKGRGLSAADASNARVHAVVSERVASEIFGNREPLGREFHYQPWRRVDGRGESIQTAVVVGVINDIDVGQFGAREGGLVFVPLRHSYAPRLIAVVNRADSPAIPVGTLVSSIGAASPRVAITRVASGWTALAPQHTLIRVLGTVAAALSVLTMLLTMVGLYAIQWQRVCSRTRENGVRLALGATPNQLRRMVLGDALVPVVQGVAIALIAGALGRATLRAFLPFDFPIIDPLLFTLVPLPLIIVAIVATLAPASAAADVDPVVALRNP